MRGSKEFSLTGLQRQIYLRELLYPDTSLNNNACVVRYRERIDAAQMGAAIRDVLGSHEGLHVRFVRWGDEPRYELTVPSVVVESYSFPESPSSNLLEDGKPLLARFCNAPFDLRSSAPLFRIAMLRNESEDALAFVIHHVISDGVSVGLLLKEIQDHYLDRVGEGTPAGPRLEPFQSFLAAEADYRQSLYERDERFWLRAFEAPFEVADLSRRPSGPRRVASEHLSFSLAGSELRRLARSARVAPVVALCGSLALTLAKLTSLRRFVMGLAVHNRAAVEDRLLHGPLSNIVPLVFEADPEVGLAKWARDHVAGALKVALRHGRYPSSELLEKLRQRTRLEALYEIVFDYQVERLRHSDNGHVELVPNDAQLHPLTVKCTQYGATHGDLEVQLIYQTAAFERQEIEDLFGRWLQVLQAFGEPTGLLGSVSLLTGTDCEQVQAFSIGPKVKPPRFRCAHHGVVEGLRAASEAVVLQTDSEASTAAELLSQSTSLARRLRDLGVGPESIVGLYCERSVARVVGVLAVLRAGAAYCPLDPSHPEARLRFVISDTAMSVLLAEPRHLDDARSLVGSAVTVLLIEETVAESTELPDDGAAADHLAYVIYTSGTTGTPKGVLTEHRALLNRLSWMQRQFQLTPADVVLHKTSFAFDVSVWELLWPFMASASMSLLALDAERDPALLRRHIQRHGVTVLHFVPSALRALLDSPGEALPTVRLVICSGEALGGDLVERYAEVFPEARLFNLYGPTEAAIDVSCFDGADYEPQRHPSVPIGRPIDNVDLHVLDLYGHPTPPGIRGELVIGGVAVARGYHNQEQLTAERFVEAAVFEDGERLYRTGDVARWLPDGNLEFLGRADGQLKVRGHRIEAGEVEARLLEHPAVREAVVLMLGDESGHEQLAAYIVAQAEEAAASPAELRAFLAETLPDPMIPSRFFEIDVVPLTANGKRDREALLQQANALPTRRAYVPPANEREVRWIKVWEETLGQTGIGAQDDFFRDLGGDSLAAVRLVAAMNRTLEDDPLTVADLTDCPTIRQLGERLREPQSGCRQAWVNLEGEVAKVYQPPQVDRALPYRTHPETVLLTGATGFVGAYVLRRLLTETRARVVCLVRASSSEHGRKRLRTNLERYGLFDAIPEEWVDVVIGDVTAPRLGLAEEEYEALASNVDHIFHFAAAIDHHATYDQLFAANVGSAAEVIDFATHRRLKKIAYASTEDIFSYESAHGPDAVRDESFDLAGEKHRHAAGYAASKWVADEIYRRAESAGVPLRLFRFGIITGDDTTGSMPEYQWLSRLLESCLRMRRRFHTPAHTRLDTRSFITPVDFLARAVVGLTLAAQINDTVFHISSDQAYSWDHVLDEIEIQAGVEIPTVSVYDWLAHCRELAERGEFLPVHPFIDREMHMSPAEVDASIAARFRGGINIATVHTNRLLEREVGLAFPRLESYFRAYARRIVAQLSPAQRPPQHSDRETLLPLPH